MLSEWIYLSICEIIIIKINDQSIVEVSAKDSFFKFKFQSHLQRNKLKHQYLRKSCAQNIHQMDPLYNLSVK